MPFAFYPRHEDACAHVGHCPHLAGVPGDVGPTPAKRGAPVGHPGWFRATPTVFDQTIEVAAPARCPDCDGLVRAFPSQAADDHVQEDVVDGRSQIVRYRHAAARCRSCRRWVQQPGNGELLGSRIGPRLRALALFLRNDIDASYRQVPRTLQELFDFPFTRPPPSGHAATADRNTPPRVARVPG